MDASINATVGMALSLQQFNSSQQSQASLLKDSLDTQASHIGQLMESVAPQGQLASTGSVGTQINTTA